MSPDNMSNNSETDSLEAEVKSALSAIRQDHFADGFEDRALARWNRERVVEPGMFTFIERRALQFLPLAIAASLFLAVYSARHNSSANNTGSSFISRTLGWSSVGAGESANSTADTYESVYATLYGLPELNSTEGAR
ncbi:MAG: hypothetical protein ABI852_15460 [Gemmatimonadaceae bacterium]